MLNIRNTNRNFFLTSLNKRNQTYPKESGDISLTLHKLILIKHQSFWQGLAFCYCSTSYRGLSHLCSCVFVILLPCVCLSCCCHVKALLKLHKLCHYSRYCRKRLVAHSQCLYCTFAQMTLQTQSDNTAIDILAWPHPTTKLLVAVNNCDKTILLDLLSLCFRKSGVIGP